MLTRFSFFIRSPILFILLFALIIRLWGIGYGLPQFFVADERATVYGALKMLELKTLVPVWHTEEFKKVLNYLPVSSYLFLPFLTPTLVIHYLLSGAPNFETYRQILILHPTFIFLTARIVIALMGTASIWLVYQFTRRLFLSERAGLLASLFLATSFYHVQLSQVTRHWMPASFFILLALLATLDLYQRGAIRGYFLASLFAGFGAGANTAAAAAMIFPVLAHFLRPGPENFAARLKSLRFWIAVIIFFGVFFTMILAYPYGLSQGEIPGGGAGEALGAKFVHLSQKTIPELLAFLWYYAGLLFTYETILLVFAFGGMAVALRRTPRWVCMLISFSVVYLTLLYLFFNIIPRGALFLLPILAVFAGYAADRSILHLQRVVPPTAGAAVALFLGSFLILFLWPIAVVLRYDYLLTQSDTRMLAADWVYTHVPQQEKILADLPYLRLTNTKIGIRALEGIDPTGLRIQDQTLLTVDDQRYPEPSREVLNLHFVSPQSPYREARDKEFFTSKGYRYFVAEYGYTNQADLDAQSRALAGAGRLVMRFDGFGKQRFDRALTISGEIATIYPWQLWDFDRYGPIVAIYEF